jgi:hypothetical protein
LRIAQKEESQMAVATQTKQNTGGQVLDETPDVITRPGDVLASDPEVTRLTAAIAELDARIAKAERAAGDETLSVNELITARADANASKEVRAGLEESLKVSRRKALEQRADGLRAELVELHKLRHSLMTSATPDFEAFRPLVAQMLHQGDVGYKTTEAQVNAAIAGFTRWLPVAARVARIDQRIRALDSGVRLLLQFAEGVRPGNAEYSAN